MRWKNIAIVLLIGTAAGIVVLGIGGRIAMRIIALATDQVPEFDLVGSLEVLAAGAWRGALGGLFYLALTRFLPAKGLWKGLALGPLLFLFSAVTLRPGLRGLPVALGVVPLTIALFGSVFIVYGIAVDFAVARWATRWKETTSQASGQLSNW